MRVPMRGEPRSKGFTLIELLIVIGLIGFLAAAVLLAVDPVKRIQESRDSRRSSETNALLNAILTKQVDDSGLYSGCCDTGGAPIITQGGPMVQVIVTSDAGIVCNSQAARPGCDKLMDTTGANKNCVAMFLATFAGTGTATSTGSSAFVTGTGTSFTTQTAAGNTVRSASGGTCTVLSVNSNTQISCSNTPSPVFAGSMENHIAGTGTATSSNTTAFVNGTGTAFTTQVQVGDMLTSSSNGVCSVQIINSNSQITCGNTPSPAFSGSLSWTRIASGQASSSGAIVTGSGSSYTTQIQAGDVLSNGSDTCTVQSVDSDTQITCTASPSPTSFGPNDLLSYTRTLSGSATSTGTTPMVFGTGTSFTTEQATATRIRSVSGSNCIIASRVSNTQITCSLLGPGAFSGAFTWGTVMSGTGTSSGTTGTVNGTGTSFTTQVEIGDTLTSASGGTCAVTAINTNTQLSCSTGPSPVFAGTFSVTSADDTAIVPTYIASIPQDPAGGTPCGSGSGCSTIGDLAIGANNSGYYVARTGGNRIEVGACKPEQAAAINAKR